MIRRDLRKRLDTKKVTFNNFSKGMEYDNFAKDPSNPRVQLIKNLELNNGKLELRKPAVPFMEANGEYQMPLLEETDTVHQVFFFPSLNNDARFLWLVKDKDGKFWWVTKDAGKVAYNAELFGAPEDDKKLDGVYMQHLDAMFIKAPKQVIKVTVPSVTTIVAEILREYSPSGWELVDAGVNLFNRDPFTLKNNIVSSGDISADALIWLKKDKQDDWAVVVAPKFSDFLWTRARLSVPYSTLKYELENFDAIKTPNPSDATVKDAFKTHMPHFKWEKRTSSSGNWASANWEGYMPLLATDILVDEGDMPAEIEKLFRSTERKELYDRWQEYRYDMLKVGIGVSENTEYRLVITYDQSYEVRWVYKTLEELGTSNSALEISVNNTTDGKNGYWYGHPDMSTLKRVLSNEGESLHLSNYYANFGYKGRAPHGNADDDQKVQVEKISLDFKATPTIVRSVRLKFKVGNEKHRDWGKSAPNGRPIEKPENLGWGFNMYSYYGTGTIEEFYPPANLNGFPQEPKERLANKVVNGDNVKYLQHKTTGLHSAPAVHVKTEHDVEFTPVTTDWYEANHHVLCKQKATYSGVPTIPWKGTEIRNVARDYATFMNLGAANNPDNAYDTGTFYDFHQRSFGFPVHDVPDHYGVTIMNDIEMDDERLQGVEVIDLPLHSVVYDNTDSKNVPLKTLDILIPNHRNVISLVRKDRTPYTFLGIPGSQEYTLHTVSSAWGAQYRFNTMVLSQLLLEVAAGKSEFEYTSPVATVKYTHIETPIEKFTWDLKSSKYLFQYWEKLGLYGFEKEVNTNKPYNYIMLSEPDNLSYFPNTRILDVYSQDNHLITKVLPWKNNLLGFTESSTTMFVGPDGERKETISTTTGLSEKNRDTAQVVSNSVVFKSGESVIAFVPAPGTDNAASLNIRDISRQISTYIKELDAKNPKALFSTVYKHEYWLAYRFEGKTAVLKYSWDSFAWTIAEYPIEFTDFFQYGSDTIIASDSLGHLYHLTSEHTTTALEQVLAHMHYKGYELAPTGTLRDVLGSYMDIKLGEHQFSKENHVAPADLTDPKWQPVEVVSVYDGDTFTGRYTDTNGVEHTEHYRILGINTPEIKDSPPTSDRYKFAILARDELERRLKQGTVYVFKTGAKSYDRFVAKVLIGAAKDDPAIALLNMGYARVDYISDRDSDKYFYNDPTYIEDLVAAEKVGEDGPHGMWIGRTKESIWDEIYGFNSIYHFSHLGEEWIPEMFEISYEFVLGNRKVSVENNMMTEEVTVMLGNLGDNTTLKKNAVTVLADNLSVFTFDMGNSHGAPRATGDTPAVDLFDNWLIGASTHEKPAVQGHTFKIRRSATTLNVKIAGTVAQKIYLDSVQFKFRETNRRAR